MFHLQSEFRYFSGTQSRGQGSLPPLYLVTGLWRKAQMMELFLSTLALLENIGNMWSPSYLAVMLKRKLHYFDLLWICSITNPQQIHNLFHNKRDDASDRQMPQHCGFVVQLFVQKSTTNRSNGLGLYANCIQAACKDNVHREQWMIRVYPYHSCVEWTEPACIMRIITIITTV